MEAKRIAVLVGSLRRESLNRKTARALVEVAPDTLEPEVVEIGGLPLYDQDLDESPAGAPAAWTDFRERLRGFDGFLFVTPEHNRGVPAALKNAVDVGSRPFAQSVWKDKPGAVVSVSTGSIGGFGSNHHLRQSLASVGVPVMPQPEAYIGNAAGLFDGEGALSDDSTRKFLARFMSAFARWVNANS